MTTNNFLDVNDYAFADLDRFKNYLIQNIPLD